MSFAAPQDGLMPLHAASVCGHSEVVGALLEKGADVEAKDKVSIARDALSP
jgi:ankyrin repeat protein